MVDRELELFPTEELIKELLNRATFQGVIVHSRDEAKSRDWSDERIFSVRYNDNLSLQEVGRLLDIVGRRLAEAD